MSKKTGSNYKGIWEPLHLGNGTSAQCWMQNVPFLYICLYIKEKGITDPPSKQLGQQSNLNIVMWFILAIQGQLVQVAAGQMTFPEVTVRIQVKHLICLSKQNTLNSQQLHQMCRRSLLIRLTNKLLAALQSKFQLETHTHWKNNNNNELSEMLHSQRR